MVCDTSFSKRGNFFWHHKYTPESFCFRDGFLRLFGEEGTLSELCVGFMTNFAAD
jgi:hypothetical protein